jgi:hypothetical protein
MACRKEPAVMKKRTRLIIIAISVFFLLTLLEILIRYLCNISLSYYERTLLKVSPLLMIAVAIVAIHDAQNTRNRKDEYANYVSVKGFRVWEDVYNFGEENIAIIHMYGQTRRAYNVTVTVTYLNVAGRVLGQEKQTVTGFVRGMEKHLCFRPGRDFHSFSYTLETTLFRGISAERDFHADGFQVVPLHSGEEVEPLRKGVYPVVLQVTEEYVGTREVEVTCTYILVDNENTVHGLYTPPPRRFAQPFPARTFPAAEFAYLSKGEIPIDEELPKEGVTGICVYTVTPV